MNRPSSGTWKKSSFSGAADHNCVEVARLEGGAMAVRHSKAPTGPTLRFTAAEWHAFVRGVVAGEFNVHS